MTTETVTSHQEPHLERQLSNRHIQLIAIGGAIGTGLFMGSGKTISAAGPSVIFVYMIIGFMLFFVMRAMGELLLSNLNYKSFSDFAADLLGPWAGFFTGWTYWFCWVITGIADVIAIAGYSEELWPGLPLWIPGLATVAILLLLNLTTVKAFGETEFWFALIKIIAIAALIVVGLFMIFSGFQSDAGPASFRICGVTAVSSRTSSWAFWPASRSQCSPSSASSWSAPPPRRPRTRRRACRRPSTPSPSAFCFSTWAP